MNDDKDWTPERIKREMKDIREDLLVLAKCAQAINENVMKLQAEMIAVEIDLKQPKAKKRK